MRQRHRESKYVLKYTVEFYLGLFKVWRKPPQNFERLIVHFRWKKCEIDAEINSLGITCQHAPRKSKRNYQGTLGISSIFGSALIRFQVNRATRWRPPVVCSPEEI